MELEFLRVSFPQDRGIASRLCIVKDHWLVEKLKPLYLFDGSLGGLRVIKDYEGLTFGFDVRLCDQIDHVAIFRKDFRQSLFKLVNFNPFFQVLNLSAPSASYFRSIGD